MLGHQQTFKTPEAVARPCAQCGEVRASLVWSEPAGERRIRHLWTCSACGCAFETQARFPFEGNASEPTAGSPQALRHSP